MTTLAPRYPHILTIAGSDSGGGAGIQADLKAMSALGCFGMSAITAVTAQNTQGVRAIHGIPPDILAAQINAVLEDIGADAVKIGMLHAPEIVDVVADALIRFKLSNIVLDPVMVATSGAKLIEDATIEKLVKQLFPLATVITPNLDEAAVLLGRPLRNVDDLEKGAGDLLAMGANAVLLKGGHLSGPEVVDVLAQTTPFGEVRLQHFRSARIISGNLHGTGCTLSSAMACRLGLGDSLPQAVAVARDYVMHAIRSGSTQKTGQGHGPLNHGFAPQPMQILRAGA